MQNILTSKFTYRFKNNITLLTFFNVKLLEISDFFTEDECDFVVEMAEAKGLKDSPLVKDSNEIAGNTSETTFKQWDANEDGFIDVDEVKFTILYCA